MDDPRPARRRHKEIRPQQLLDAALPLFVEKGFAATRAEEVARRAGVSKGTLYLYYPSKAELFKAVVRHHIAALIGQAGQIVASAEGGTGALLRRLLEQWWTRIAASEVGGLHKVVLSEVRNFPEIAQFYVDEVVQPARSLFESLVRRGIGRGEFRPVDVSATANALMAPMIFLLLHEHSFAACPVQGFELDPVAVLAAHIDLVLDGLHVRGEGAR
ncbi:MAG TPA: TetR/AcrR family transcriptional regulator [Rubrivivax sp.]|nr:TetR/AcrR family transcriptional regulator [Burkholderiales bacterium]HNT38682.1 TetR/AcrR family transcriptional regulator [Rubrivivax sp.]